jgi:hypothetical protein
MIKKSELGALINFQGKRVRFRKSQGYDPDALMMDEGILKALKDFLLTYDSAIPEPDTKRLNIGFDRFWFAYDKKVGRKECEYFWAMKMTDKEREACIRHIPKYKKMQPEMKFRVDPIRYLRNKRYHDEMEVEVEVKTNNWLTGDE